ncbi:RNA polymerase II subunit B1 CTD phosphatase RPAP2, putative [Babesia caballi]|uniref:RNA polymerase II subunit B1 CTD phosphatase RPAP2, putative n=1 Tax=Babesia caballi TaxID=5871 RepID=A0AAV4LR16_BABCB|nr:RNA polymerase II subunit B1 CTD phosphatase RPAP2, putative [Babesia caballi]
MSGESGARPPEPPLGAVAGRISPDRVAAQLRSLALHRSPERPSNTRLFQRFLELLNAQCSGGARFHCVAAGPCCAPCAVLRRHVETYVDVAALEEIQQARKQDGLCGYLYCNRRLRGRAFPGRGASTYKIDLAARRVYRRQVYESFCSAECIERNAGVEASAAASPMEVGVITPRAVRISSPKSLQALLSGLRRLEPCMGAPAVESPPRAPWEPQLPHGRAVSLLDDMCVMFNYQALSDVRRVRFAVPEDSSARSSLGDTEAGVSLTEHPAQVAPDGSEMLQQAAPPPTPAVRRFSSGSLTEGAESDYASFYDPAEAERPRPSLLKCLNLFSILWYTLSTCVTMRTCEFLRSGAASGCTLQPKTRQWYEELLRHVPEDLAPLVSGPLESLIATFRIGNNTPTLNEELYRVLAHVLVHVLLRNGEVVLAAAAPDEHLRRVEDYLVGTCRLDVDSLSILNELLTDCEGA